jgi:hypothetical protein
LKVGPPNYKTGELAIFLQRFIPNVMMIANYGLEKYGKKQPCICMKEARDISITGFCTKIQNWNILNTQQES